MPCGVEICRVAVASKDVTRQAWEVISYRSDEQGYPNLFSKSHTYSTSGQHERIRIERMCVSFRTFLHLLLSPDERPRTYKVAAVVDRLLHFDFRVGYDIFDNAVGIAATREHLYASNR